MSRTRAPARRAASMLGLLLLPLGQTVVGAQTNQARPASNAAYLELLGNGGAFSLNYERRLSRSARLRIGAASWTAPDLFGVGGETSFTTVPVLVNWLRGSSRHHLELGAGILTGHVRETFDDGSVARSGGFTSLTGVVGYRRQRLLEPGQRFAHVFRVGLTPFVGLGSEETAYPERGFFLSGGVSYGLAF